LEDTQNIVKATGISPKKICYYTVAPWKWKAYLKAVEKSVSARIVQSELMRELMKDPELKAKAEQVAKFTAQMMEEVNKASEERKHKQLQAGMIDENQTLKEAKDFFKREINAEIHVYQEEDPNRYDPKKRAQLTKPYRPAIYIE